MNREQAEQLLAAYLFDELDPADRAALEQYLETDSVLREQLADMRLTVKLLDNAAADQALPTLSPERYDSLMAAVQHAEAEETQPRRSVLARIGGPRTTWTIRIAALVLIGTVLIGILLPAASEVKHRSKSVAMQHASESPDVDGVYDVVPEESPARPAGGSGGWARESEEQKPAGENEVLLSRSAGTVVRGLPDRHADEAPGRPVAATAPTEDSESLHRNGSVYDIAGSINGNGVSDDAITSKTENESAGSDNELRRFRFGSDKQQGQILEGYADWIEEADPLVAHDIETPEPKFVGTPPIATAALKRGTGADSSAGEGRTGRGGVGVSGYGASAVTSDDVDETHTAAKFRLRGGAVGGALEPESNFSLQIKPENAPDVPVLADAPVPGSSRAIRRAEIRLGAGVSAEAGKRGDEISATVLARPTGQRKLEKERALPRDPQGKLAGIIQRDILGAEGGEVTVLDEVNRRPDGRVSARSSQEPPPPPATPAPIQRQTTEPRQAAFVSDLEPVGSGKAIAWDPKIDVAKEGKDDFVTEEISGTARPESGLTVERLESPVRMDSISPEPLSQAGDSDTTDPIRHVGSTLGDRAEPSKPAPQREYDRPAKRMKENRVWRGRLRNQQKSAETSRVQEETAPNGRDVRETKIAKAIEKLDAKPQHEAPDFKDAHTFDLSSMDTDGDKGKAVLDDSENDAADKDKPDAGTIVIGDIRSDRIDEQRAKELALREVSDGYLDRAREMKRRGNREESIAFYEKALRADPDSAEAKAGLKNTLDTFDHAVRKLSESAQATKTITPDQVGEASSGAVQPVPLEPEQKVELPVASKFKLAPVNPWVMTDKDHLSTFALDVDTASYALCRNYLRRGYLPPRGAVRMEEFVNAFDYNYPRRAKDVFNVHTEAAPAPFARVGEELALLKIGVQGKVIGREGRKPAHLVFVVDTSGSMARFDRLPLVKHAMKQMVAALNPADRISLIAYGREAQLLLEAVPVSRRQRILKGIDQLKAGDSTNLLSGMVAGYRLAQREFKAGQINRVILCSDGVANVGQTDAESILERVAEYRKHGITLTAAGFGHGSYNDELMEDLAKKGDGNYLFIDTAEQAQKVFVDQMTATLQTIAMDAKIQVDFNPQRVRRYRLIGYEKRDIEDAKFRDDTVDAAEIGSGKSATALYELELITNGLQDDLPAPLGTVYVRYRNADTEQVEEIAHRLDGRLVDAKTVEDRPRFYLAACAAEFAELLRQSEHAVGGNLQRVQSVMEQVCRALPLDQQARELLALIRQAQGLPRAP